MPAQAVRAGTFVAGRWEKLREVAFMRIRKSSAIVIAASLLGFNGIFAAERNSASGWTATWATANVDAANPVVAKIAAQHHATTEFGNPTIRETVHTAIGSSAVRIRLENTSGTQLITFDVWCLSACKKKAR
jgi:hypothetical protein